MRSECSIPQIDIITKRIMIPHKRITFESLRFAASPALRMNCATPQKKNNNARPKIIGTMVAKILRIKFMKL